MTSPLNNCCSLDIPRFVPPKVRLWRATYGAVLAIFIGLWLFLTLLFFNIAQISTLVLYPFSYKCFRKANRRLANIWWGMCHLVSQDLLKVNFNFQSEKPLPVKENVIIIANHQCASDIPVLLGLAFRQKRLGDLKWFIKEMYKYMPGIGIGMTFVGTLFVKRSWEKDREMIKQTFQNILRSKQPFWISMFAEGTRLKSARAEKSALMAERYNVEPFKHVLFPATKGFVAATQHLRANLDAIYDVTIFFPKGIPTIWAYLCGFVRRIDVHIKRYEMSTIPDDSLDLSKWLVVRYQEKEALLAKLKQKV